MERAGACRRRASSAVDSREKSAPLAIHLQFINQDTNCFHQAQQRLASFFWADAGCAFVVDMRSVWRAIAGGDGLLRTILAPAFSATVNFWPLYEGVKGATLAAVRTVEGAAKAWRSTARARGRKRRAEDIVGPVFSRCLRQS